MTSVTETLSFLSYTCLLFTELFLEDLHHYMSLSHTLPLIFKWVQSHFPTPVYSSFPQATIHHLSSVYFKTIFLIIDYLFLSIDSFNPSQYPTTIPTMICPNFAVNQTVAHFSLSVQFIPHSYPWYTQILLVLCVHVRSSFAITEVHAVNGSTLEVGSSLILQFVC